MEFFLCNKREIAVRPAIQTDKIQLSEKSHWENVKITDHEYRFSILKVTFRTTILLKRDSNRYFPVNITKFLRTVFFEEHFRTAASDIGYLVKLLSNH